MSSDDPVNLDDARHETEVLAGLIRSAGRRAEPPETAYRQTLAVALDAWHAKTARVALRRRIGWIGAGAAAALAAGIAGLSVYGILPHSGIEAPLVRVATVERSIGTIEVGEAGQDGWRLLDTDRAALNGGTRLRTGPGGRAALRLAGGASLRLAENTELTLPTAARLELAAGRAYVDSGGEHAGARVELVTSIASVTDVGTQFEVSLAGQRYRLRVREGRVLLRRGDTQVDGTAGEQLTIGPDGAVERTSILPTDAEWGWVESIATAPDVNDRPVTELLDWVARETGRPIRFKDAEVERRAASTILHGSIRHLAPLDALSVMLATTDLDFVELADGTLLIQSKPTR